MKLPRGLLLMALLLTGFVSGCCRSRQETCQAWWWGNEVTERSQVGLGDVGQQALPAVVPQLAEPELSQLAPALLPDAAPENAYNYRGLEAIQCQCLAASQSAIAQLLEDEQQAVNGLFREASHQGNPASCSEQSLRQQILLHAAEHARNQSASAAMQLYFGLMKAEAKRQLTADGLKEIAASLEKVERLRMAGVAADANPLEQQRLELQEK